jgi:isopenicillin N synthase-like dioxygenase
MAIEVQSSPSKPIYYQGKPIQIAQLQTINFSRLLSQEPAELGKLLHLCKTEGFFYLDLQDIDGRRMLDDKARLLKVMERFFNSSHDEKNEIGLPSQEHGLVTLSDTWVLDCRELIKSQLRASRKSCWGG